MEGLSRNNTIDLKQTELMERKNRFSPQMVTYRSSHSSDDSENDKMEEEGDSGEESESEERFACKECPKKFARMIGLI